MTPLLARVTSADRQFERIYQRHAAEVYRYALVVLRNPHDAEDVTQTTFMNAYRAMQNGERPESPKNWLVAIAHNVCRQRFRQAQRRPQESALYEESVGEEPADPAHTAEDIQRALGQLAFNQRAALVMRELEGRSYAEIGAVMGLSVSAVETVIFRARRALREQLEGSLSCDEAEFSLSRQLDGELPRAERGPLRAHLRQCKPCAQLARSQRASRGALKALLGGLPVPASFLGGGGGLTLGVAAKAAAVVCAGAAVGTGGYEAQKEITAKPPLAAPRPAATHHAVAVTARVAVAAVSVPARGPLRAVIARTPPHHLVVRHATRPVVHHAAAPGQVAKHQVSRAARVPKHANVKSTPRNAAHPATPHPSRPEKPTTTGAETHGKAAAAKDAHGHAQQVTTALDEAAKALRGTGQK